MSTHDMFSSRNEKKVNFGQVDFDHLLICGQVKNDNSLSLIYPLKQCSNLNKFTNQSIIKFHLVPSRPLLWTKSKEWGHLCTLDTSSFFTISGSGSRIDRRL